MIQRHNEVRNELGALCAAAFSATRVRNEPLIEFAPTLVPVDTQPPPSAASDIHTQPDAADAFSSQPLSDTPEDQLLSTTPPPSPSSSPAPLPDELLPATETATALRGDLLVRGFFSRSTDTVFDIRLQDLDVKTYVNTDPLKCLQASEKEKKQKCQKKCFEHRRTFVPFIVSVDGMFAPEAVNTMKHLAQLLSNKWRLPTSVTLHYVKSRMSVAVVRATNLCLRGTRMKNHTLDDRRYLWDEEGLHRLHNQHF